MIRLEAYCLRNPININVCLFIFAILIIVKSKSLMCHRLTTPFYLKGKNWWFSDCKKAICHSTLVNGQKEPSVGGIFEDFFSSEVLNQLIYITCVIMSLDQFSGYQNILSIVHIPQGKTKKITATQWPARNATTMSWELLYKRMK